MSSSESTMIPQTNVFTTFAEEEFGATDMGRTTTNQKKKNKNNKLLYGGSALLVALLLLIAIFGVTYLSIKKSKKISDGIIGDLTHVPIYPGVKPTPVAPSGGFRLSPDRLNRLDGLTKSIDDAMKRTPDIIDLRNLASMRNACTHLYITGDADPIWFDRWFDLAKITYFQYQMKYDTAKMSKATLQQYNQIVTARNDGDNLLEAIARSLIEKSAAASMQDKAELDADAGTLTKFRHKSLYYFDKRDYYLRKKGKKSGISKSTKPERTSQKKPKSNKTFEKEAKKDTKGKGRPLHSKIVDHCLMQLAETYSRWHLK